MEDSPDYGKAYRRVSRELKEAVDERDVLDNKITTLRKRLAALAANCEDEGIEIDPSPEAEYLLQITGMSEDIVNILKLNCPGWLLPWQIKNKLEQLGYDMSNYKNPLATVHMVLKRLAGSDKIQQDKGVDDKTVYRASRTQTEVIEFVKKKTKK